MAVAVTNHKDRGGWRLTEQGPEVDHVYRVMTDDPFVTPAAMAAAVPVSVGHVYEHFGQRSDHLVCSDVRADPDGDAGAWRVTCSYRVPPDRGDDGDDRTPQQRDDPLTEPPDVSFGFEDAEVPLLKEKGPDPEPVVNSAGQAYDPQPTKLASRTVIRIVRNERVGSRARRTAAEYQGKTNADTWEGFKPGTVRVRQVSFAKKWHPTANGGRVPYLAVTYVLVHDPDGWDAEVLDKGEYHLGGPGGAREAFTSESGVPYHGLLDGSGGELADGADPVFKKYRAYDREPFKKLRLPAVD